MPSLVGPETSYAAVSEREAPPMIADDSKWEFTSTQASGAVQKGMFRLEDGMIYHLDLPQAVGKVFQDEEGYVHLVFVNHRKISGGEAVVKKIKNGRWQGNLYYLDQTFEFSLRRL